jgi:hypothetical protein
MLALSQTTLKDWGRRKVRLLSIRQLGVHCRWNPSILDELQTSELELASTLEPTSVYTDGSQNWLYAGNRTPEAGGLADVRSGEQTKLFDVFRPTHHTVIAFRPSLAKAVRVKCLKDTVRKIILASASAFASANATATLCCYTA